MPRGKTTTKKPQNALIKEIIENESFPSDEDILKELILYSEKILLKRLQIHCEKALIKYITQENVVELYKISMILGAEDLREIAREFMMKNFDYFADKLASL